MYLKSVFRQKYTIHLLKSPIMYLLQSSSWAKVKDNWGSEIVGVMKRTSRIKFSFNQTISRFYDVIYTKRSSNGLYK